MRIVILCSSVYSETACAAAVRLADMGYALAGALSLSTFHHDTLPRKLGQWGVKRVANYACTKLLASNRPRLQNKYLQSELTRGDAIFRNLNQVAKVYGFPVAITGDQNSRRAIASLKTWSPDLIVFTGGNILRREILEVPRLGVLNIHLGLLPQIRGMNSPEWSLLNGVPVGITFHFMNSGVDTGPILQKYEYTDLTHCTSLGDLRHRLIAFGIEKVRDVVAALDRGTMMSTPQCHRNAAMSSDNQYFVMHEWLQERAARMLAQCIRQPLAEAHA